MIDGSLMILLVLVCLIIFVKNAPPQLLDRLPFRHSYASDVEAFSSKRRSDPNRITFLTDQKIYDSFYASIYDLLVYSEPRLKYELKTIEHDTMMNPSRSRILDIGCGTGHHVAAFLGKDYKNVTGIDLSEAMLDRARKYYPQYTKHYRRADALNPSIFHENAFTHILCMYFTIYEFKDKNVIFRNARQWLLGDGYFVVHLVDREKFNPLVPMSMPYLLVNPQTFAHERMTKSKVVFDQYSYEANFELDEEQDMGIVREKFTNRNTSKIFRKTEMHLHMESIDFILTVAKKEGFKLVGIVDLLKATYEYQYLYIFQKQ